MEDFAKNIRHIINIEVDKCADVWRSKLKTEQKERDKMREGWQEEKKITEELQSENDKLKEEIKKAYGRMNAIEQALEGESDG